MTSAEDQQEELFDSVVGTVALRVSDLGLQRAFYEEAIGLALTDDDGSVALLSGLGGVPLVRLDASRTRGASLAQGPHTGLFHIAFRYPDRAALGAAVKRTAKLTKYFDGASDHGVSEAVYFTDPEGNGIELYRDRPLSEWPQAEPGRVGMFTLPLDLPVLVAEADDGAAAVPDIGHIHLRTADVDRALEFWRDAVGLDERQRFGAQAVFLAEGLYHHHIGANSWQSAGASPAPGDVPGLESFELRLRDTAAVDLTNERLEQAGVSVERDGSTLRFRDADSNGVIVSSR
ncbi:MAG TPA: VOC family protein [Solirubrobacterales bacterium]|nr:VOC family protein [Solirubrobacterales bacterium]